MDLIYIDIVFTFFNMCASDIFILFLYILNDNKIIKASFILLRIFLL